METEYCDVIIVGAGVSGLTAAYELIRKKPGASIIVLEALDRVGGRTWSVPLKTSLGTHRFDVGGQWVGKTQPDVMSLLKELGLETYPQYIEGFNMAQMDKDGPIEKFKGEMSGSVSAGLDALNLIRKLQKMAKNVSPLDPFKDGRATEWNNMSVRDWVKKNAWTKDGGEVIEFAVESTMDTGAEQTSMLFFLMYLNSAGSDFDIWTSDKGKGAQAFKIKNGAQSVSDALMAKLPPGCIRFSHEVKTIQNNSDSVVVETEKRKFQAQRVIVAVPPLVASKIVYNPPLPEEKVQLMQNISPKGQASKMILTYPTNFWRQKSLSGQVAAVPVTQDGTLLPAVLTYDATSSNGEPALIAFIDEFEQFLSSEQLKVLALKQLERFLGPEVSEPLDIAEQRWKSEPYAQGCVATAGTGVLSKDYAKLIREPLGRVHWAGTETATVWMGYISGAIQAGRRAADEVVGAPDFQIKAAAGVSLANVALISTVGLLFL